MAGQVAAPGQRDGVGLLPPQPAAQEHNRLHPTGCASLLLCAGVHRKHLLDRPRALRVKRLWSVEFGATTSQCLSSVAPRRPRPEPGPMTASAGRLSKAIVQTAPRALEMRELPLP